MLKQFLTYTLAFLCLLSFRGTVNAQEVLDEFITKASSSFIQLEYSYVMDDGKVKMRGEGQLRMQSPGYHLTGGGLEVWSDGSTKWTVDRESREVVMESFSASDVQSNPLLLLNGYKDFFRYSGTDAVSFSGRNAISFRLVPKDARTGMESVEMYFSPDGNVLVGVRLEMKEGIVTEITIPSMKFSPASPSNVFLFDVSSLPKDFIVTDLRM